MILVLGVRIPTKNESPLTTNHLTAVSYLEVDDHLVVMDIDTTGTRCAYCLLEHSLRFC